MRTTLLIIGGFWIAFAIGFWACAILAAQRRDDDVEAGIQLGNKEGN